MINFKWVSLECWENSLELYLNWYQTDELLNFQDFRCRSMFWVLLFLVATPACSLTSFSLGSGLPSPVSPAISTTSTTPGAPRKYTVQMVRLSSIPLISNSAGSGSDANSSGQTNTTAAASSGKADSQSDASPGNANTPVAASSAPTQTGSGVSGVTPATQNTNLVGATLGAISQLLGSVQGIANPLGNQVSVTGTLQAPLIPATQLNLAANLAATPKPNSTNTASAELPKNQSSAGIQNQQTQAPQAQSVVQSTDIPAPKPPAAPAASGPVNAASPPPPAATSKPASTPAPAPKSTIVKDIKTCRVVLPPLAPNPVANVTKRNDNIVVPKDAVTGERPRATTLYGNLNSTRYERFYLDESIGRVPFENVTVTTRINSSVPESWELPVSANRVAPFDGIIESPKNFTNWEGFSEALFQELNLARTNPKQYAVFVKKQMDSFVGDYEYMDCGKKYSAMEGKQVWQQAIDFLNKQKPLAALRRVQCLDCSANYMVNDLGNARSHESSGDEQIDAHRDSRGELTSNRTSTACLIGTGGENIAAGTFSARSTLLQLIVDDYVFSRGHRLNIFTDYTQVGIASSYNEDYGTITVHDFLY